MGRTRAPFLAAALLIFLGGCSGCAARRTAFPESYRLTKIGGADFLLPPDFPQKSADDLKILVSMGKLGTSRDAGGTAPCSIRDRWFALDRAKASQAWVAQLPAPFAWYHEGFYAHSHEEWNRYFDQIYELEEKGCITPQGYEQATHWIEQSMPAPAMVVSFFRESLDRRGFLPLRPGMRLFIERSIFRPGSAETVANYVGEMRVYYQVVGRRGGRLALKLRRIRRSKGLSRKAAGRFPDGKLAPAFAGMHALRLFYLTLYVPPKLRRNSLLVGARNPAEMARASHRIEKEPEIPCRRLASAAIPCAAFEGMVSASVEMNVRVNGKEEYVPVGTKVESILNFLTAQERAEAWKTLRIRRLFRGRHYDIEFGRENQTVPQLVLFSGDEISWAVGSASSSHR